MRDWWQSLNPREQWLVAGGGVFLFIAILYLMVIEPLRAERTQLTERLVAERTVLQRITNNAKAALAIREQASNTPSLSSGTSGKSLLAVVNQTAAKHSLQNQIRRIVPNGTDKATVAFDTVPFDELVRWLTDLQQRFGVVVSRINLDKEQKSGFVRANLSLAR